MKRLFSSKFGEWLYQEAWALPTICCLNMSILLYRVASEGLIYMVTPLYTTMFALQLASPLLVFNSKKAIAQPIELPVLKPEEPVPKPKKKRKPRRTLQIQRMPGTTKKDMKAANFKTSRKTKK